MSFRNFKCNFLSLFCKQLFTAHRSSALIRNTSLKITSLQKSYIHSDKVRFTNFSFLFSFPSFLPFITFPFIVTCFLRLRIHGAIKRRAFVNHKSHKDAPAQSFSSIWLQTMTLLRPNQQRTGAATETNSPLKRRRFCTLRRIICKVGLGSKNRFWPMIVIVASDQSLVVKGTCSFPDSSDQWTMLISKSFQEPGRIAWPSLGRPKSST